MTSTAVSADATLGFLAERYREVRRATECLCEPLVTEDYVVQSMPDASPTRWHLAHTTWFFETFVLKPTMPDYKPVDSLFEYLFNSYYNTVGDQFPRPQRGLLTRPTVDDVKRYRAHVDRHVLELLESERLGVEVPTAVITVGLHHEQQHQELMLTDLKHLFSRNPLHPVYREVGQLPVSGTQPLTWHEQAEDLVEIGFHGGGFAYDNECPRHRVFVEAFELASRLVTCGEYLAFIEDGGYHRPAFWLSDGWKTVGGQGWQAPLYWENRDGHWMLFTLSGVREISEAEPVCHVSYYEADAYARWAGARLPTEAEWEVMAADRAIEGNFVDDGYLHPVPDTTMPPGEMPAQLFGDVWEWAQSPYVQYPGYRQPGGALGEYNAKFMSNQMVLRGGSCATRRSHIRATYRNFLQPEARWQFSGIRLARDGR